EARIAGLEGDLAGRFLEELAQSAGLTLHVRLVEGRYTQHVLEAIFRALGVALAQSCRPRGRENGTKTSYELRPHRRRSIAYLTAKRAWPTASCSGRA